MNQSGVFTKRAFAVILDPTMVAEECWGESQGQSQLEREGMYSWRKNRRTRIGIAEQSHTEIYVVLLIICSLLTSCFRCDNAFAHDMEMKTLDGRKMRIDHFCSFLITLSNDDEQRLTSFFLPFLDNFIDCIIHFCWLLFCCCFVDSF